MSTTQVKVADIRKDVENREADHIKRLSEGLRASLVSVAEFQKWITQEMKRIGMEASEFWVDPAELLNQPAMRKTLRENPSALNRGPNVVGKIPGKDPKRGVLLFGHADKPPETYEWGKKWPDLVVQRDRLQGPGIADDVAGLTSMLSAVETYRRLGLRPEGDVLVASILGKQLGVFGTYGLVTRFGPVGGAIYVHPAESGNGLGDLKMTSLGMLEFYITIEGKKPDTTEPYHTIYSLSGVSAIDKGVYLIDGLYKWAAGMAERPETEHTALKEQTGQSFALSFGRFLSGAENLPYHIPAKAVIQGDVTFAPGIRLSSVQEEFEKAFRALVEADPWLSSGHARLEWGDVIAESCQSDETSEFLAVARTAVTEVTGKVPRFYYGHSVSDLRYPMLWWKAQGFGVGPLAGDMNTETEYVDRTEYLQTIMVIAEILKNAA